MLDDFSKRLAAMSAVLLALSVVYDYFYVRALGLTFAQLPTTIADHVRTAVIWVPGVALVAFLGLLAGWTTQPVPESQRGNHPIHKAVDRIFFFGVVPSLVLISFFGPPEQAAILAALLIGILLIRSQPGAGNVEARLGQGTAPQVFVLPAAFAMVAWLGWFQGAALSLADTPVAAVTIKQGTNESVIQATGLRRFTSSTVVVEPTQITVLPSDSIMRVQYQKRSQDSIACLLIQKLCPQAK